MCRIFRLDALSADGAAVGSYAMAATAAAAEWTERKSAMNEVSKARRKKLNAIKASGG
jgi:hypothetical protein